MADNRYQSNDRYVIIPLIKKGIIADDAKDTDTGV